MAGLLEYKCPCCGGSIKFDSSLQKVKCEYCDTEFELETLQQYDQELSNEEPEDMSWAAPDPNAWTASELEGMRVYVCKSCGGEIVADETTAATACPYCGNPIVVMGNFSGDLKPDYVIPFKYDKKAAKEALMNHFKGKKLLPKVFKDENHIDEVKGVYVPYWLYSADAVADIRYRATRVRVWSDSQYNYQETSYYSVMRSGDLEFERVPVDGSSRMADDMMESLEPFDFSEAVDFQTAYLAGYLADKYDVTAEDGFPRASERVRNSTAEAFMDTVQGFATVTPENTSIRLQDASSVYALYPVWILNTTWQGQKYTFAMNGQTGKFVGNLPEDKGAYWKYFLSIAGITTAVITGISFLMSLL